MNLHPQINKRGVASSRVSYVFPVHWLSKVSDNFFVLLICRSGVLCKISKVQQLSYSCLHYLYQQHLFSSIFILDIVRIWCMFFNYLGNLTRGLNSSLSGVESTHFYAMVGSSSGKFPFHHSF